LRAQAAQEAEAAQAMATIPVPTVLMLPAPVVDPLLLEINALAAKHARID